ncbi:hypothetical protein CR970_01220 [Candidatus Saccharibacteria bacterium]|nr:MAG: hypothetical protein CR970_01220 [Candidatus Saccharibacteria bacterium]
MAAFDTNTESEEAVARVAPLENSEQDQSPDVDRRQRFQQDRHERKEKRFGVLLLLIAALAAGYLGGSLSNNQKTTVVGTGSEATKVSQQIISNESQLISAIAKDVGQSVVSINVVTKSSQIDFFGFQSPYAREGAGTGVIISDDGYVITNRHVVPAGTSDVSVTLSDGTELDDVKVVGRTNDRDSLDVAFLKIGDTKDKQLAPAKIGDSAKVVVGDKVVAIGNALGQFENTVTAGIISGFGRSIQAGDASGYGATETLQNLFQTDAAINQGNSGGPLVNVDGEVIGINTAVAGGMAQNIGFAIPINDAKGLIESVLTKGKLERPYLGVRYVSLTDDFAYQYNLDQKRGAYIAPSGRVPSVISGSPAEKAGLQEKDIITHIDGVAVDENNSLTSIIGSKKVGDQVSLTIVRDREEQTLQATLEAAPKN